MCDAGCINGNESNSSCLGKACWGVDFSLTRASASFLLAAVSMVTKEERAKFDAVNCWRTVVLLAGVRAKLSRAVPSRSMVAAGAAFQELEKVIIKIYCIEERLLDLDPI